MDLRGELRNPVTWLLGAFTGGMGWAVLAGTAGPAALAVGAGIGAAVMVTKAVLAPTRGEPLAIDNSRPDTLPLPAPGSPAALLVARADVAAARLKSLSTSSGDPWLREAMTPVRDADEAVASLRQVAGRVTLVEESMRDSNPDRLLSERARMQARADASTDPRLQAEQRKAIEAIDAQLQVAHRLATLRETLLVRMESAVLGLEGLAARTGELVALGPTAVDHDRGAEIVKSLTSDLETLRSGIEEVRQMADPA